MSEPQTTEAVLPDCWKRIGRRCDLRHSRGARGLLSCALHIGRQAVTELLKTDHLRQIALVLDKPGEARRSLIPVLQWSVNIETGRPVSRWVLSEDLDAAN